LAFTSYDIRPGNGAGLFFQPRSRHGARDCWLCAPASALLAARTRPHTSFGLISRVYFAVYRIYPQLASPSIRSPLQRRAVSQFAYYC